MCILIIQVDEVKKNPNGLRHSICYLVLYLSRKIFFTSYQNKSCEDSYTMGLPKDFTTHFDQLYE